MEIGIVVNPRAKRARDPVLPERLQDRCDRAARTGGGRGTVAVLSPGDPTALDRALGEFLRRGVDVLGVCGGDGTLMAVASALGQRVRTRQLAAAALPALLILPGGTMNTAARNLGLCRRAGLSCGPGLGPPPAEALLDWALQKGSGRKGPAALPRFPQELLHVRTLDEAPFEPRAILGDDGDSDELLAPPDDSAAPAASPGVHRYGFLFAAAMGARFLAAYASGTPPGPLWAGWLALRTIGSSLIPGGGRFAQWLFRRTPIELFVDEGEGDGTRGVLVPIERVRLLIASTIPDVGLGMRVPWRAGMVPERFQLIASDLGITQNALQLGRILRGLPMRGAPHHDAMAVTARLRFARRQPFTLDGDLFTAAGVELGLGPRLAVLGPAG